ncbi:hypothetical protein CERZMDRAFT_94575 [Cercospora zeae-maydis SCOH1-5]|uniref:Uncharacterized protein n=1 Tax=Cercospora zeae-maydis SCOH1-5 TaxID=717836 RepID=A0A6A6FNW4_9PEZI|nr:hypothetical protein CERZMDRAFT_94575 [Cercospora zeae-maydis SCOH1-5]
MAIVFGSPVRGGEKIVFALSFFVSFSAFDEEKETAVGNDTICFGDGQHDKFRSTVDRSDACSLLCDIHCENGKVWAADETPSALSFASVSKLERTARDEHTGKRGFAQAR